MAGQLHSWPFLYADIFSKNIHKLYWNCMVVPLRCCFEPRSNCRTQSIYIYIPKLSWPTYKPTLLSKKSEDTPIYPSSLWPTLVTLHRRRGTGNTPWLCLRPWGRRRSTDLVSWSRGKLWFGGENQEMSWHVHLGKWLMVEVGWSWLKNRLLCKTDRSLKSSYYHPGVHWFQDQSDYWKWPL